MDAIKYLKQLLKRNGADTSWFPEVGTPQDYIKKMARPFEFVDALFLNVLGRVLRRDIVIIHAHPETVQNGIFNWLKSGGEELGAGVPCQTCPMFLCKYALSEFLFLCCL